MKNKAAVALGKLSAKARDGKTNYSELGKQAWLKLTPEQKKARIEKLVASRKSFNSDKYNSIHKYNLRKNGTAKSCVNTNCAKKSDIFDWALLKGEKHGRDIKKYISLCRKCHRGYDTGKMEILTVKR